MKKQSRQRRDLAKALKALQSSLGDLNDFAVHDRLATELALAPSERRSRRQAFAAGLVAGKERSKSHALLKAAKKALRDVAKARRYWAA